LEALGSVILMKDIYRIVICVRFHDAPNIVHLEHTYFMLISHLHHNDLVDHMDKICLQGIKCGVLKLRNEKDPSVLDFNGIPSTTAYAIIRLILKSLRN
jgi:hypothetical protein